MKVISLRRGFATNSSSSHSIIFSADSSKIPDGMADFCDFGWNYFVQKTQQEKMNYIYQAFSQAFGSNEEMAEYFNVPVEMVENSEVDGYIDHDSYGMLDAVTAKSILHDDRFAILGGNDNQEDPEWTKAFQKIDGGELSKVSQKYEEFLSSGKERQVIHNYSESMAIEKGVVTTFNNRDGVKVRYNMEGDGEVYLSVPELVDIKITDYCPYGCSYCYQNSTEHGLHADYNHLLEMIDLMKNEGVFELAIGGGEPTLHPHFHDIINACVMKNEDGGFIVPNFTTRNLSVFKKGTAKTESLLSNIGGFAYSVDGKRDVRKLETVVLYWLNKAMSFIDKAIQNPESSNKNLHKIRDFERIARNILDKVSIQIVLGAMSRKKYLETVTAFNNSIKNLHDFQNELAKKASSFNKMIREGKKTNPEAYEDINPIFIFQWREDTIAPTVMLLGYKTTGRGSSPDYDYTDNALTDISSISQKLFNVGIDTAAAQQIGSEIKSHKVPKEFYYVKEGVASCYIDAVADTMASSSYCPEVDNNTMDKYSNETFLENFKKYQHQGLNAIPLCVVS